MWNWCFGLEKKPSLQHSVRKLLIFKPSRQKTLLKTHECFPFDRTSWLSLSQITWIISCLLVCLFSVKAAYFHTTFLECLITAPNTCMEAGQPPPSRLSLRVWPGFDFMIRERSGSPCWLFIFCYGIIHCCSIEIRASIIWGIMCPGLVVIITPSRSAQERQVHTKPLHDY